MAPDPVRFEPGRDALQRDAPLTRETVLPVLGIPVRFRSNAEAVIEIAEAAFGPWRVLEETPGQIEEDGVEVRVVVHPGDEGGAGHVPVMHRVVEGHRVLYHTPGSVGIADPDRRQAVAFVTPAFVADPEHFRYVLLESLTLATVTPLDRQPFHAAALERDGTALLLAGPSGTGKSTLAYAAVRSGFRVLAEDVVFLQSRPRLRVWGLPGWVHLPPDVRRYFPELADETPTLLANGKRKLAVDLRSRDALAERPVVDRARVCVVERGDGSAPPVRLPQEELLERLARRPEPGFDLFADTIREPLRPLTEGGGWLLKLPADPRDAVEWLDEMLP